LVAEFASETDESAAGRGWPEPFSLSRRAGCDGICSESQPGGHRL